MKHELEHFLHTTEKKVVFESSKDFFFKTEIEPNFNFEDLEVIAYLLNYEEKNIKKALQNISEEKLSFCYNQVEKKMPFILAKMEKAGILVCPKKLEVLKNDITQNIEILEKEIQDLAGESFNINSPKQVNEVLFKKLELKTSKKTSGGGFSTSNIVLEDLALEGVLIAKKLIEFRHLSKLLNTYVLVLLDKAKKSKDGRIRTTFSSISTTTGRINSKNPNLQNLPAKTDIGLKVRECFIGGEGKSLISFDYSQIELRILAHLADIKELKEAFFKGEDIHKSTASIVFGVPLNEVTQELRNNAKAINFGIIYGLSSFALAKTLNISPSKAKEYIHSYFEKYKGIQEYMKQTEEEAKQHGFVRTMLGKKCYLEGINSSNYSVRSHAIRAGINARIQGSAADLIKKAMIQINEITNENCMLVLQIHDELVFEITNELIQEYSSKIKFLMENAVKFTIPIAVNYKNFNLS